MKFVSPGNDGVPDRIIVLPGGGVIFVELKDTKGKLMANQRVQISRLRESKGALVFVVTRMPDAKLFVEDMERKRTWTFIHTSIKALQYNESLIIPITDCYWTWG